MVTVNAWLYMPWLAFSGGGMIDWNTPEDYMKAIESIKEFQKITIGKILLLTHQPQSNDLTSWSGKDI